MSTQLHEEAADIILYLNYPIIGKNGHLILKTNVIVGDFENKYKHIFNNTYLSLHASKINTGQNINSSQSWSIHNASFIQDLIKEYKISYQIVDLPNQNQCSHIFLAGPRKGHRCPKISKTGNYCYKHTTRSVPDNIRCKHFLTFGTRKGTQCILRVHSGYDYCKRHYQYNTSQCNYIIKGSSQNFYCSNRVVDESLYCSIHQTKDIHESLTNSDSDEDIKTCPRILYKGTPRSKICGKVAGKYGLCDYHRRKKQ